MSELAEILGYRNPPKTTHNMVGKQVKLYLIKNKKKNKSEGLCPPHYAKGHKRQAHYRSVPPRHMDKVN